jgi:integrase
MTHDNMEEAKVFKTQEKAKLWFKALNEGKLFKFPEDTAIIKRYVNAKFQGNYRHIIYDCNAPEKTVYKNLLVLKKITNIVQKPLISMTEEDVVDFQSKLNQNLIYCNDTERPISVTYKKDIVKVFKQFWTFYRTYAKQEEGRTVENIAEFFRIRKEKNLNPLVKFLTKQEIDTLACFAHNLKMRALIKCFFESGARTIEILNLRRSNCSYDSKKRCWIIKLPNMKGISTAKMPIELDYSNAEFDAWLKHKQFADSDLIFNYSYDYFRIFLATKGKLAVGRKVTPKMFRKSCAMHLVNLDINEQYIKSHMGWSASSKAISHYIDQKAIQKPEKLKSAYVQDSSIEMDNLKIKLKQMEALLLQRTGSGF